MRNLTTTLIKHIWYNSLNTQLNIKPFSSGFYKLLFNNFLQVWIPPWIGPALVAVRNRVKSKLQIQGGSGNCSANVALVWSSCFPKGCDKVINLSNVDTRNPDLRGRRRRRHPVQLARLATLQSKCLLQFSRAQRRPRKKAALPSFLQREERSTLSTALFLYNAHNTRGKSLLGKHGLTQIGRETSHSLAKLGCSGISRGRRGQTMLSKESKYTPSFSRGWEYSLNTWGKIFQGPFPSLQMRRDLKASTIFVWSLPSLSRPDKRLYYFKPQSFHLSATRTPFPSRSWGK